MDPKQYGTGVFLNAHDNRNIPVSAVLPPVEMPTKCITDISMLEVENQQALGTCVGQAEGKGEEYRDFKETGVATRVSKRFIYTECKKLDNNPAQGTWPAIAAKVLKDQGAPKAELVPDDNALPYEEYLKTNITNEIKTDASGRRVAGYAFGYTLADIKNAIVQKGTINATMQVGDWSRMPLKPTPNGGLHRVLFYGYEDADNNGKADTKVYGRNSWGKQWGSSTDGNFWFWWSEYEQFVYDLIVYTDMPNTVIDYAKAQQFKFTRVLHIGMSGTDVMELQKRLRNEVAFDGQPCYGYAVNGQPYFSTYFGPHTEEGVKRYQKTKGLVSQGTYKTTGYGQVGPKTMATLNQGASPTPPTPPASRINDWALAIQKHEGWYVGSRSYRNNNPGNLRYVGQAKAIGQDSGKFCIFRTYDDGFSTLTDMLVRCATGKSTVYKATMSLYDFFATYAPAADSNNPKAYAEAVAKQLGVDPNIQIKDLA